MVIIEVKEGKVTMLLLQQMIIFFLIMLVGYICRKVRVFGETTGKTISGIVINIGNPALIIASGMNPETLENKEKLLITLGVALIFFIIMFVIAELIPRVLRADREDYGAYQVMTIFSNIGFMGYPLLDAMYGSEAVIHAAIFNLLYSVLIYTYGINKMKTGGEREKLNWRQLLNVGVISCGIAVILYISNIPVPMIFEDTATRIGAVTGPLSMLVIGDSLAQIRLKELFTDVRLLIFSVLKLILMPALLLWGLGFFITDPMFRGVCLVMTATPVGSMTVMLAQQYDGDYRLTSKGVALTTILSVVTMPFLFWLLQIG